MQYLTTIKTPNNKEEKTVIQNSFYLSLEKQNIIQYEGIRLVKPCEKIKHRYGYKKNKAIYNLVKRKMNTKYNNIKYRKGVYKNEYKTI